MNRRFRVALQGGEMQKRFLLALALLFISIPTFAFDCDDDFLMLAFIKHSWHEPIYILRNRDEEKKSTHRPLYGGTFSISDNPFQEKRRLIEFTLYCWPEHGFKAISCSSNPSGTP